MEASSPLTLLTTPHEDWLDIDDLSPSLPDVCLQDVESVVLLGTLAQQQQQQQQQMPSQHNLQSHFGAIPLLP